MAIKIAGTDVISDDKRFINNESLPSIRPSLLLDFANSKTLDPRIDFTRSSTATYYDGKTHAKAEENLGTYSENFSWTTIARCSVSNNSTTAPDGTTTAAQITDTSDNDSHYINDITTALTEQFTYSVYAKEGTLSHIALWVSAIGGGIAYFNLSTGAVGTVTTGTYVDSASIQDVGNGWYRCSITSPSSYSSTSTKYPVISVHQADNTFSYTGTGQTVYVWGRQYELRDSVTAYTPTTSQPITNYIPVLQTAASGTARFDHDPVTGESKGLLIEEQRTNLLDYSASFNTGSGGALKLSNNAVAPDGTITATTYSNITTTDMDVGPSSATVTLSPTTVTYSAWFKAANADQVGNNFKIRMKRSGGTLVTAEETFALTDEWVRQSVTMTMQSDNTGVTGYFGGVIGSEAHVWGAQLEAGSFPTSYIPTSGSQVTRSADSASMTGDNFSSWYRQDEGTVYGEAEQLHQTGGSNWWVSITDGTLNNIIDIAPEHTGGNALRGRVVVNGSTQADINSTTGLTLTDKNKCAIAYAVNDFAVGGNGEFGTDTNGIVPNGVNQIHFGKINFYNYTLGHLRKFAYYPTRLTNAELQALTED